MRKNYRLFCSFVVLFTILLMCSACGKGDKDRATDDNTVTETEEVQEIVLETVEEQILVDEAGVQVILNELTYSDSYGKGVNLTIVNNTMKALTFDCKKMLVNGIMTPDLFGERLQPGETKSVTGYFGTAMFDYIGIDNVGEITFVFDFFDSNYESVYTSEDILVQTSAYENIDTEYEFGGEVVYEGNGMTIYGRITEDEIFECAALLFIDNDSDSDYLFKADGVTLNGTYHENLYATDVRKNSCRLVYIEFTKEALAEGGIDSLDEFGIEYVIFDRGIAEIIGETGPMSFTR